MLRALFSLSLALLIAAPALIVPAYSLLPFDESGPLISYKPAPSVQGEDVVSVNGFAVDKNAVRSDFGAIDLGDLGYNGNPGRTLFYGSGNIAALSQNAHIVGLGGSMENGQPMLGVAVSKSPLPSNLGFSYAADSPLQFDFGQPENALEPGRLSGSSIIGSDAAAGKYGITGDGVKVAIVDTGTDFSNPDMRHSLARDKDGVPIMIDADGQGIVLTNATYIAKIDPATGKMLDAGYTPKSELPEGMTSYVYLNNTGEVLLRTSHGIIPTYNSLYPFFGAPVLDATARVDWKIGDSPTDYIRSASGVYRFGIIYQVQQQFGPVTFALVPVLVVDSEEPGVYDTIIPDMYSAWYFFTRNELARIVDAEHLYPEPSFDFTDDKPIKIGGGNEFLVYDYNSDGFPDFSAGTVGAKVVDVWQVVNDQTEPLLGVETGYGGVVVADLLEPLDPKGEYFGVMYDSAGHGTSTAATVASKGEQKYDIYDDNNGNSNDDKDRVKYQLAGIAPGAKIIPVKALWAGDSLYGWLYASGFDLGDDGKWRYSGDHKADVISNSWGVASFPLLQYGPGYDILSVFSSLLSVPGLLADGYPGTVMINSIGNNGLGYGSIGSPNAAPLTISVGATTNNVHIGYNGFAQINRFGNSSAPYDEIADFSSRGPSLLGDPKPELMAVGEYAFTPAMVSLKNVGSTADDPNNDGAFALFGGTSMAAPMVAGVAALVIEELRDDNEAVDPFKVKSIMMSAAKDLKNDPFVQGSGRVDAVSAVELARGKTGKFSVYTEDTVSNVLSAMSGAIYAYNNTLSVIEGGEDVAKKIGSETNFRESRWFAGHIKQGKPASTEIVIENPSEKQLEVEVMPAIETLVARHEITNATRLFETDPVYDSEVVGYAPNYFDLEKEIGGIPGNADLMVARVTFPFSSFMNSTEIFGDHLRIASVYSYDWDDSNNDGNVSYTETSMINRGGSWGTVQELRVSDPAGKFKNTPLIGIYPVPTVFSFWQGDRQINSTAMNYTLTVEFYERQPNPAIKLDGASKVTTFVEPESIRKITATIDTTEETLPGVYYGSILVKPNNSERNTMVMPVSYVVTSKPVPKDVPVVVAPDLQEEEELGLRPNGYVGGLFDMTSRYAAGDWRSYYFTVSDDTVTSMSLKLSWPHNSTSINAMAFGPDGRMVASSVPAGVFETFAGWPTNDWLGTSPFSEGGAFYFSQNAGENATLMHVPVNQTGVYSVLVHNTLFHGNSLYEPIQVEAKFSTILPDSAAPVISVDLPKYLGGGLRAIPVSITEENPHLLTYAIDSDDPVRPALIYTSINRINPEFDISIDSAKLAEGAHRLRIDSSDSVGHAASLVSTFEVDNTPPTVDVYVQDEDGATRKAVNYAVGTARGAALLWNVTDKNGVSSISVTTYNGSKIESEASSSTTLNSTLPEGDYMFSIDTEDTAGNRVVRDIKLAVDRTAPSASLFMAGGSDLKGMAKVVLDAKDANLHSMTLSIGDRRTVNVTGLQEYEFDTTELLDGQYELKLAAVDLAGNEEVASTRVTVSNMAPQILSASLLGLLAGAGIASAAWFLLARRRRP